MKRNAQFTSSPKVVQHESTRTTIDWIPIVLVMVVALVASIAGINNDFANDDVLLIEQNARVHDFARWYELFSKPYWPPPYSPDLYRPLTSMLLATEFVVGLGSPAIFRVLSYLLYAVCAVGVLLLAKQVLTREYAIAAAVLFAAHPIHVEAVALAVGQSELVVGIIAIAGALLYLRWRTSTGVTTAQWLTLGALYAAAILFKEHAFVLPGLLLTVETVLVRHSSSEKKKATSRNVVYGMAFLATIAALLLLARRAVLHAFGGTFVAPALVGVSVATRWLTMSRVAVEWARLFVWPVHLRADYSPQEIIASTHFGLLEAAGVALLIATIVAIWFARRRAPAVAFGLTWCVTALIPVSNLILPTGVLIAERTLFLASVGFVIAVAGFVAALVPAGTLVVVRRRQLLVAACGVLVAAGVVRSAERQRVWRNDGFLSVRTVQDSPRSYKAQRAYGNTLFWLDQPAMAMDAYQRAMALAPDDQVWRIRNEIARHFRERGERRLEIEQLQASLAARPGQDEARGHLVAAYLVAGLYESAALEADTALARGGTPKVYVALREIADSAERVNAPPGSIRVDVSTGLGP